MAPRIVLAAGAQFGRLTVVSPARQGYLCACACGAQVTVARKNLVSGHTKSCGCLSRQAAGVRLAAQNARRAAARNASKAVEAAERAVACVAREVPVTVRAPEAPAGDNGSGDNGEPVAVSARVRKPPGEAANERRARRQREKRAEQRRIAELAAEPAPPRPASAEEMVPGLIQQARAVAWRHYSRAPAALDLDELQGAALAGLSEALAAWPGYCARRGFRSDGPGLNYLAAYALRRMNGAIIDFLRSEDPLSRSARQRAGQLRDAGHGAGATEAELSERTGLSVQQVRDTEVALASRPVHLDADGPGDAYGIPDPAEDVQASAVAASITSALVTALKAQPAPVRVVVALRYYEQMAFTEIAEATGLSEARVTELHNAGVCEVHAAMAAAAR